MKLRDLLRDVPVRATHGDLDVDIASVTADSRLVTKGALFVAIPGTQLDGAKFIDQALGKGAVAVVAQSPSPGASRHPLPDERGEGPPPPVAPLPAVRGEGGRRPGEGPYIEVDDPRAALALIAANFHGRPAEKLSLVGVTGTSGKTTTTKMIESIFDATGDAVGLIGTIEYRAGDERLTADRTTPDAVVLQEWFAKMAAAGVKRAVMEVSSHALALKRTYGIRFVAAVFTNLSRDHFDFHKDFDDYFAAKRILFDQIPNARAAVVNRDDEYGRKLIADLGEAITFGMKDADITPEVEVSVNGLHGRLRTPIGDIKIESNLLGQPNLYNWMGAVGAAIVAGVGVDAIEAGIRNLDTVRGRFERVSGGQAILPIPTVIVDYAHKPDALEKLLHAVRDIAGHRKVVVVFGCGGDRDKGKRPLMGEIAGRLADRVVVTSDNPRGEDPKQIVDEIVAGMKDKSNVVIDRRDAIARTIAEASDDDVIVIAGKGHESYQVVGDRVIHFDDREEAELALKKRADKAISK